VRRLRAVLAELGTGEATLRTSTAYPCHRISIAWCATSARGSAAPDTRGLTPVLELGISETVIRARRQAIA
jgi:hypothetical protein